MTWEKIVHHVVTIYRHDISNKLQNKTKFSIPKPKYTEDVQLKQKQLMELLSIHIARLCEVIEPKAFMLTQAVKDGNDLEAPIKMTMLKMRNIR